jgi:dihydrofolate reductase
LSLPHDHATARTTPRGRSSRAYSHEAEGRRVALLIGRKAYESFAGAWPTREGQFADKMNRMPKFVASTTLETAEWNNSTVLEGFLVVTSGASAIETLKLLTTPSILER